MTSPAVSIVIPHYNRVATLRQTLDCVRAQTFTDWEVIIVDDCSPVSPEADLQDYLADPRFRLVRMDSNGGPSAARNLGIAQAAGVLVAFLDSDDLWLPRKLEAQMRVVSGHGDPEALFVTTQVEKRGATTSTVSPSRAVATSETFAEYLFLNGGVTQTSTVMLGRRSAQAILFDPAMRQFEDYLFFLKAGALGLTHVLVPEPLTVWLNDDRGDRLSKGSYRNMEAAWQYLDAAGALMDRRSRLVFLSRHVGPLYIREHPIAGTARLMAAVLQGLVRPRLALSITASGLLPKALLSRLKSRR